MPWFRRIPLAAGIMSAGVAALVLVAWQLGIEWIPGVGRDLAAMQPTTATAVLAGGLSLLHPRARLVALVPLLFGLAGVLSHMADLAGPLVRFSLLPGTAGMSLPSALALTLFGVGQVVPARRWVPWPLIGSLAIGVVGMAGYLYAAILAGGVASYTGMSILSAGCYALLASGALLGSPDDPLIRYLRAPTLVGAVTRQLLFATWCIPLVAGLVRLEGERLGAYGPEVGVGIMVIVTIVTLTGTSLLTIRALARADRLRDESESWARSMFEHAPVGLVRTLADGTILDANPTLARRLGIDREELRRRNAAEFYVDGTDRERWVRALMAGPEDRVVEARLRTADGAIVWGELRGALVYDEAGTLQFIETSIVDITQRKRYEADLERSQRLEATGQLAGSIAHDFNNLLTVIAANGGLLLRQLAKDDPRRPDVQHMVSATDRAAVLTRQLLVFSRRQLLAPRVVNVNDLLAGLAPLMRSVVGEAVELELVPGADLWAVRVDTGQIEQVITNLVINARDAMPEGGRVVLETANVILDDDNGYGRYEVENGEYVRIAVSDTGTGIPREILPRIFEPFFSTKAERGTGLGLAGAWGIVRQSGGHIFVYSEVGQGTTFKIYLPRVHEAPQPVGSVAPAPEPARGGETILLVDDNDAVRRAVRRLLEYLGYTVLPASGAEEALALALEHRDAVDLVLTDVVMPDVSGPELVEELRELGLSCRVLYATGYTDDTVLRDQLVEPGAAVLQKPVSLEELARKVREVLDRPA